MCDLQNKANTTNVTEEYFDFVVCSGKTSGTENASICDCNNKKDETTASTIPTTPTDTPVKKGGKAGGHDTPTRQYWYEETSNFTPISTFVNVGELREQIVREYLRAKSEETRIENKVDTSVTVIETSIDNIEEVITNITEKVDEHTDEINNLESGLTTETHDRIESIEKVEKTIETTKTELENYIDTEIHSINIELDIENDRQYNVFAGDDKIGEFLVPYENLESVYLDDNNVLKFNLQIGKNSYKTLTVDLKELKNIYSSGQGIVISEDNVISANVNPNNRFISINAQGQIDCNVGLTNLGDIWTYYLTDYNSQIVNESKIDLTPIKEYIDDKCSGGTVSREYVDNEIASLKEEIYTTLDNLFKAGNNIKIEKAEDGTQTISVKVDNDIHVDKEYLLIDDDGKPKANDTLDEVVRKILKNIVTNADAEDGEQINM